MEVWGFEFGVFGFGAWGFGVEGWGFLDSGFWCLECRVVDSGNLALPQVPEAARVAHLRGSG